MPCSPASLFALVAGLWAAPGCAAPPAPRAPGPETPTAPAMENTMNGAQSPAGDSHPGSIEHVDEVTDRTHTRAAADVPRSIAWVQSDGRWVPVVRVVATGTPDRRRINRYGPDGALLDSTIQAPPPPQARPTPTPQPTPTPTPQPTPEPGG